MLHVLVGSREVRLRCILLLLLRSAPTVRRPNIASFNMFVWLLLYVAYYCCYMLHIIVAIK